MTLGPSSVCHTSECSTWGREYVRICDDTSTESSIGGSVVAAPDSEALSISHWDDLV